MGTSTSQSDHGSVSQPGVGTGDDGYLSSQVRDLSNGVSVWSEVCLPEGELREHVHPEGGKLVVMYVEVRREVLPLFMYEKKMRSGKEKQQTENTRESKT